MKKTEKLLLILSYVEDINQDLVVDGHDEIIPGVTLDELKDFKKLLENKIKKEQSND